jgi:hypothetical protein
MRYGFATTYEVVTPDSAAEADCADHGYLGAGGWRHSTAGKSSVDAEELAEAHESATHWLEPEEDEDVVDLAARYLRDEGVTTASTSNPAQWMSTGCWFTAEGEMNYRTGEHERHSFHPTGEWTNEQLRRIAAALRLT